MCLIIAQKRGKSKCIFQKNVRSAVPIWIQQKSVIVKLRGGRRRWQMKVVSIINLKGGVDGFDDGMDVGVAPAKESAAY